MTNSEYIALLNRARRVAAALAELKSIEAHDLGELSQVIVDHVCDTSSLLVAELKTLDAQIAAFEVAA